MPSPFYSATASQTCKELNPNGRPRLLPTAAYQWIVETVTQHFRDRDPVKIDELKICDSGHMSVTSPVTSQDYTLKGKLICYADSRVISEKNRDSHRVTAVSLPM
jgi:hypothetical protein